jgi:hypothetical protein
MAGQRFRTRLRPFTSFVAGFLMLFVLTLALAPGARAGLRFPPPQDLSEPHGSFFGPQVGVDPQGRATVVWQRIGAADGRIESVRVAADGTPGQVQALSEAGENFLGNENYGPQVAVDPQGRATVVWSRDEPGFPLSSRVESVRVGANGVAAPVQTLSEGFSILDPIGDEFPDPQVAVDSLGRATVVWDGVGVQSVRIGADGTLGPVRTLSPGGVEPRVGVDSRDRVTVAWLLRGVQAVRLGADGVPGAVQTLGGLKHAAGARDFGFAVGPKGAATAVWWHRAGQQGGGEHGLVESARLGADGTPGGVRAVSPGKDPQVAVDRRGRATVVWYRTGIQKRKSGWLNFRTRVQSASLRPDGSRGAVKTLSKAENPRARGAQLCCPEVALDQRRRAIVVWARTAGRGGQRRERIQARRLPRHGTPEAVQTLSSLRGLLSSYPPKVAVDPQGRPTVVWSVWDGPVQSTRGDSR